MANITKWKHGLKGSSSPLAHQDYETLDNFIYKKQGLTGRLEGSTPIATTLNTFYVGEQHGISSGNENLFFENQTTNINWYPPWMGVKNHKDPINRTEQGLIYPTYRLYGTDIIETEFNGVITDEIVEYKSETVANVPISVFGIEFVIGEDITMDDLIHYRAYIASETMDLEGARAVYEQSIKASYSKGQNVTWWFDHPVDAFPGYVFFILVYKKFKNEPERLLRAYGSPVVNPNIGDNKPWINLKFRTFEDIPISSDPVALFITEVKPSPGGSGTVTKISEDGFNVDEIITDATRIKITVEWDRARNHLDTATINGVPVNIKFTQGGTHTADVTININPTSGEDIVFRVGRTAVKRCKVTAL